MFVLALVHTFPFIIVHIEKGDLVETWNTGGVWVTGVVALIAQAWLTFMSIPWIRCVDFSFFSPFFDIVTFPSMPGLTKFSQESVLRIFQSNPPLHGPRLCHLLLPPLRFPDVLLGLLHRHRSDLHDVFPLLTMQDLHRAWIQTQSQPSPRDE